MKFEIEIQADKEQVWETLWQDRTLREWAGIIDPVTYMKGKLRQGGTVQFISAENGYGVTSLVKELRAPEYVLFLHAADTQGNGTHLRQEQWTGGAESYLLTTNDSATTLTATFDVPAELEDYFTTTYPKALEKVKQLAEHERVSDRS